MSFPTLAILAKIKDRLDNATAEQRAANDSSDIVQYSIRLNGKVVKTFVFNMKEFSFVDGPFAGSDAEITIDDEHVAGTFRGTLSLEELLKQGKIDVKGNAEILKVVDERNKNHAAAMAAAQAAAAKK